MFNTKRDTIIDKMLMSAGLNALDTDTLKLRKVYLFHLLGGLSKIDWNVDKENYQSYTKNQDENDKLIAVNNLAKVLELASKYVIRL